MKAEKIVACTLLPNCALFLLACGDPIKDAQQIEEPRVLAVQVEGEAGTATPSAGETATVSFLLAGPEGPRDASVAFLVCEAADSARGVPYCVGDVFAEGTLARSGSAPTFDFAVPLGVAPETRLAVLGVACVAGEPVLSGDPADWSCSSATEPLRVSFDAYVGESGSQNNQNPDLSQLAVRVSGQTVPLESPDTAPSCEGEAVVVAAGGRHTVQLELGSGTREGDEWLQVSHFATQGTFDRQYTIIEPGEAPEASLSWRAPSLAAPSKQYVVVRDGAGGVAFATWSVCAQ